MSEVGSTLTVGEVLLGALRMAHQILEGTMAGVDDEIANRPVPGRANPIGASYLHVAISEDHLLNHLVLGAEALYAGEWAGRFGGDRMEPQAGEGSLGDWYRTVRVDLAQARAYMAAVAAASEAWLAGIQEEEFGRIVEGSPIPGLNLAAFLEVFLVCHANNLSGEISAIKGTFGLQGYPF